MGKQCGMQTCYGDWTKEERMAYLDWDRAEEDRVEAMVAAEMKSNTFSWRRACVGSGRLQQRIVRHRTPYIQASRVIEIYRDSHCDCSVGRVLPGAQQLVSRAHNYKFAPGHLCIGRHVPAA